MIPGQITSRGGDIAPIMGTPKGKIDISADDFEIIIAGQPVLFGLDPAEEVVLTVVNKYDEEVEQIFRPMPNPYFIKKVIEDASVSIDIYYFL